MATFTHGSQATLWLNGTQVSQYFKSVSLPGSVDTAETSALGSTDKTFIPGLQDAKLTAEGMHDSTTGANMPLINAAVGAGTVNALYFPEGHTIGKSGYGMKLIETGVEVTSPVDDVVSVKLEGQTDQGSEYVVSSQTLGNTTGGTATSVDGGAATTTGLVVYFQASGTGTSAGGTILVQDSANNSVFSTIATIPYTITANVPSITSTRWAQAGTVRQYTRLVNTLTGGTISFIAGLGRTPNSTS